MPLLSLALQHSSVPLRCTCRGDALVAPGGEAPAQCLPVWAGGGGSCGPPGMRFGSVKPCAWAGHAGTPPVQEGKDRGGNIPVSGLVGCWRGICR